ncbi:hypothetical protein AALP_AAs46422U000100 [Arabis alpina]|uniref:Uncharacterized protein n=1 Tax=Arabis alpina TaxID=50452 RepID=A0A087FXT1_ARAAL|nr:hypothetical protein AALP_AAs46422U000100 [Arabis alpina]
MFDVSETPTDMGRYADAKVPRDRSRGIDDLIFVDHEDPDLSPGRADASFFSSSSGSQVSGDDEVEQTMKAASTQRVRVRPDPPGSTLSKKESLQRLREKCRLSEDIELVVPSFVDRADAPPPGYMTLFENYFDQCLLWFPLPGFLMRFLVTHGVCLLRLTPRALSRECGVDIFTDHLSYLTDFRVHGRSDKLKHTITNASGMTLIAEFLSKDDHFEDHFFFVEIYEKTVEADCIDLVKTIKPSLPEVSKKFVKAMHKELSSENGNWKESFSRKRIKRAFSAQIIPGKILGRGRARASSQSFVGCQQKEPSLKKRWVDTSPAAVVDREASANDVASPLVSGLFRDEAYAVTKSKPSELSLLFDRLVGDYDEDKIKKGFDAKLAKLKLKCSKGDDEIASLKTLLSSASDLQSSRIGKTVAAARGEMTCGFAWRVSEVVGLLAEIGGKVQNNMLNFAEIDANLEFIGLLRGSSPPDLPIEIKALHERRRPIYNARDMFRELLDRVRELLKIPEVSTADEVDDETDDEAD